MNARQRRKKIRIRRGRKLRELDPEKVDSKEFKKYLTRMAPRSMAKMRRMMRKPRPKVTSVDLTGLEREGGKIIPKPRCMERAQSLAVQKSGITEIIPVNPGLEEFRKFMTKSRALIVFERKPRLRNIAAANSGELASSRETKNEMMSRTGAAERRNP